MFFYGGLSTIGVARLQLAASLNPLSSSLSQWPWPPGANGLTQFILSPEMILFSSPSGFSSYVPPFSLGDIFLPGLTIIAGFAPGLPLPVRRFLYPHLLVKLPHNRRCNIFPNPLPICLREAVPS